MIVEDEVVIALRLQKRLTSMGFDIKGLAYTGEEAVEKAKRLRPDLILMDIMIPGKLDGIAAAKIVKAELGIPVVFLTAFAEDKIIKRAKKAEPYGYILKPFQDREIKAAIEVALYKKETEKALKKSEERYRALAENSKVGFWQTTLDGYTLYINPAMCRMLEIEGPEELHGKIYHSFYDAKNLKIVKRELAKREKGLSSTYEVELKGNKGTKRNVMISGAPIFFSEDKIHSAIGTFTDITNLKKTEKALIKARDTLEHRVKERTVELDNALKKVTQSEKELLQRKLDLEKVNKELLETNQAVSVLARNIDREKELLEKRIHEITSTYVIPIIKELQNDEYCQKRQTDLELLKTYLDGLILEPTDQHEIFFSLSNQEMRVAAMIKGGLSSPKISELLNISLHTVKSHRKNIRKKLKLQNSNVNLTSYLKSKFRE